MGVPTAEERGIMFTPICSEVIYHEPERLSCTLCQACVVVVVADWRVVDLFRQGISGKQGESIGVSGLVNDIDVSVGSVVVWALTCSVSM